MTIKDVIIVLLLLMILFTSTISIYLYLEPVTVTICPPIKQCSCPEIDCKRVIRDVLIEDVRLINDIKYLLED